MEEADYREPGSTTRKRKTYMNHYHKLEDVFHGKLTDSEGKRLCKRPIFPKGADPSLVEARKVQLILRLAQDHAPGLLSGRTQSTCETAAHPSRSATQMIERGKRSRVPLCPVSPWW
jgi:hypothetical protein